MTVHRQSATLLPIKALVEHPGNVRQNLGDLAELEASIWEQGLLQPLIVTEKPDQAEHYVVLDGHRRLRACISGGLTKVPAIVRHHVEERDQVALMLVADIHKRPLDAVERAEAYGVLRKQGLSLEQIGRMVGTGPSNVSKYLALLDLDEASREQLRSGRIATSTAIEIVREVRQERRAQTGRPSMGRPSGKADAAHFSISHPLAGQVRLACTHRGRVGGIGCGACWESAIRADERQVLEAKSDPQEAAAS